MELPTEMDEQVSPRWTVCHCEQSLLSLPRLGAGDEVTVEMGVASVGDATAVDCVRVVEFIGTGSVRAAELSVVEGTRSGDSTIFSMTMYNLPQ
jgi:hypothetical protein